MIIQKNEKTYTVAEYKNKWTVKKDNDSDKISVVFDIPKDTCPTAEDLKKYVLDNKMF